MKTLYIVYLVHQRAVPMTIKPIKFGQNEPAHGQIRVHSTCQGCVTVGQDGGPPLESNQFHL